MMFRTGSVDEISGKTGLAHMFEHMMFKGTKTLGTKNYAAEAPLLRQIDALHQSIDQEKDKGPRADQKRIGELIEQVRGVEEKANALVAENELWIQAPEVVRLFPTFVWKCRLRPEVVIGNSL